MEPEWRTNIGEQARQIMLHTNRYSQSVDVVILSEQTLFIMQEHGGTIRYQRRYSFSPSCFLAYNLKVMGEDLFAPPHSDKSKLIDEALTK
mmetsp:Transcript_26517/g.40495  ORF Transcript_26517/g.40495 Transcript_26517/m.40495 type:complete len:91 (+) Transcript_26517:196-468(+)